MDNDTIVAIATAPGEAGIGIVRLSGKNSIGVADKIFQGKRTNKLVEAESRKLNYGHIVDPKNGDIIDEVLLVYMNGPHTYTREDIVEINCHGGIVPVRRILEICLENGARMAEAGEFTKRAFLNGRIDLSQAEAVMDLISAKTDTSFDVSLNQLEGSLSSEVNDLRQNLLEMLAHIEASIDFPEHDEEYATYNQLKENGTKIYNSIERLLDTAYTGKILREGLKTVILGKPNVGKSSLMNRVLKESRAIVTDIPGTTRDIIEEYVNIKGIPLKIVDTAGIRETEDVVEKIGVDKAKNLIGKADLVIAVFDISDDLNSEDMQIIDLIKNNKAIALLNKTDLPNKVSQEEIKKQLPNVRIINTSMITGMGVEVLEDTIKDMFFSGEIKSKDETIVTNVRHKDQLQKALENIKDGLNAIEMELPYDLIEVDLKNCWENLGEITGDTVGEDLLDKIFQDFCIGK
ncbi:MAG: tRNA uridine-5-carboxymethylaminomethyl(34) synthesis GTPase MnmE [Firmicutes bacterium]|nr:tRNA uridine-5-carboxymethylaminomethyl(34) synthesis GTPase MnmE [Bacillota bacterium]